jgi:hypothetical protein
MSYVDYLARRHDLHRSDEDRALDHLPPIITGAGRSGAQLPENLCKTVVFAETASRGGIEHEWFDQWIRASTLAKQQQWLMYDWSLSGAVRQTAREPKGPAVTCRHLPVALRPPERPPVRSSRPPTAGFLGQRQQQHVLAIAAAANEPPAVSAAQAVLSSPRMRRPPSAAVMVANLKAAVPQSFMHRVAGQHS